MARGGGKLVLITGKGGVGKTTISAAVALASVEHGLRTLVVEQGSASRLAYLLGGVPSDEPQQSIGPKLTLVCINARQLVEDYFRSLLRFSFLSRRLFESSSFNALTAAAPGISEFLLLEKVVEWLAAKRGGASYDVVILDGPATGHAIKLLRSPNNLRAMVPAGPLASSAERMIELLHDPRRTQAVIVGVPEELSVQETIETYRMLHDELGIALTRPVANRMYPQPFTREEATALMAASGEEPALSAARFLITRHREAERNVGRLRRALGVSPVRLDQVFAPQIERDEIRGIGRKLLRELDL